MSSAWSMTQCRSGDRQPDVVLLARMTALRRRLRLSVVFPASGCRSTPQLKRCPVANQSLPLPPLAARRRSRRRPLWIADVINVALVFLGIHREGLRVVTCQTHLGRRGVLIGEQCSRPVKSP